LVVYHFVPIYPCTSIPYTGTYSFSLEYIVLVIMV